MDIKEIINKAAATAKLEKKAQETAPAAKTNPSELEKSATLLMDKADVFDTMMGSWMIEKAAAYEEFAAKAAAEGYRPQAIEKTASESDADVVLKKCAAYDSLVKEISADIAIEKAAEYDKLTENQFADKNTAEDIMEKAAAYDYLVVESEVQEVLRKAAEYDKAMEYLAKEAEASKMKAADYAKVAEKKVMGAMKDKATPQPAKKS